MKSNPCEYLTKNSSISQRFTSHKGYRNWIGLWKKSKTAELILIGIIRILETSINTLIIMELPINEETLKNTTKCKKKFSCLKGNRNDLCKVKSSINGKINFVECINSKDCNYRISYGYSFICMCPVRNEFYNHFNI